jgi:hypothetical protein
VPEELPDDDDELPEVEDELLPEPLPDPDPPELAPDEEAPELLPEEEPPPDDELLEPPPDVEDDTLPDEDDPTPLEVLPLPLLELPLTLPDELLPLSELAFGPISTPPVCELELQPATTNHVVETRAAVRASEEGESERCVWFMIVLEG